MAPASTGGAKGGQGSGVVRHCGAQLQDIRRYLQRDRPRTPRFHLEESLRHLAPGIARVQHDVVPLGQPAQDRWLMRNLVQIADALADVAAENLPGQAEDLGVERVGGRHARGRVQQAWTRHDIEDARLAGRQRVTERHISAALFVPRVDDADAVAVVEEGVVEPVVLDAGQPEERV